MFFPSASPPGLDDEHQSWPGHEVSAAPGRLLPGEKNLTKIMENHGKIIGNSWKIMGKESWDNHRKIVKKTWEGHDGKMMGKA